MPHKGVVLLSLGVGMMFGSGLTLVWIWREVRLQIQKLRSQILDIQEQVALIKDIVSEVLHTCNNAKIQIAEGSLEEEEVFEEAYDGPLPWLSSLSPVVLSSSEDCKATNYIFNDTHSPFFKEVDCLFVGNEIDQMRAYKLLKERSSVLMQNVNFLWRFCKSAFLLSQVYGSINKEEQKRLVYEALNLATKALQLDDTSSNAHKWYAITLGSTNDFESANVKIQNGYKFKEHIDRAISLNPSDPSFHYLLGRWCYGVYMLSWIERKIAATLFSTPPQATIDESLQHFLKADFLNPEKWKENMLFIAKCYVEKKDFHEAVQWLRKAENLPIITTEDKNNQTEIEFYLEKCAKF